MDLYYIVVPKFKSANEFRNYLQNLFSDVKSVITQEQYNEIKLTKNYPHTILNPLIGKYEWVNPNTNEWEVHDIE